MLAAMTIRPLGQGLARDHRRRLRELQRRRGRNVHQNPAVREAWRRCRELSLAYLDAVVAAHNAVRETPAPGATRGWGRYANLAPDEQEARQAIDPAEWRRVMEDTPWFPGRTLGEPALERLEEEMFGAWSAYGFHARAAGETCYCAGFDVEKARLYRDGAAAVGPGDGDDELGDLMDGGVDLSGTEVAIVPPPEADLILGPGWTRGRKLPTVVLETRLIPDWNFPGYWLTRDNRAIDGPTLADLLADDPRVDDRQRAGLRGDLPLADFLDRR